jgi:predicted acyltransferase
MIDGSQRLISLDVFRGMTIAAMVLVNNPGGSPVYWPLEHAAWHGLTPTDWIFPFFLFIVGVSVAISFGRSQSGDEDARHVLPTYKKIFTRALVIYLLGAAMSVLPFFQFQATDAPDWLKLLAWVALTLGLLTALMRKWWWTFGFVAAGLAGIAVMNIAGYNVVPYNIGTFRIMGVLQRIALVYLVTSVLFLHFNWRQLVGISAVLLLGYWLIMTVIPVPGCDVTTINDKACNLAAYLDRVILTENHIWRGGKVYDPEGLLSTLPAIVTCISGVLAGMWLVGTQAAGLRVSDGKVADSVTTRRLAACVPMFFFGLVLLALGLIWHSYFPMNKALWTSSYVLATSGLALLIFGACYWLIDIQGYKRWAWPFVVFGVNAMPLFVFSGIWARMHAAYRVAGVDGQLISVQKWTMQNVFLPIWNPIDASLAFAISFILLWLFLMWLLYRKQIFIRV